MQNNEQILLQYTEHNKYFHNLQNTEQTIKITMKNAGSGQKTTKALSMCEKRQRNTKFRSYSSLMSN